MAGASGSTKRVRYVNMNWEAGDADDDGRFTCLIVTEDGERHVVSPGPLASTTLIALTQASNVLLWDPDNRTLIAANLVGEFFQDDWSAGDRRRQT